MNINSICQSTGGQVGLALAAGAVIGISLARLTQLPKSVAVVAGLAPLIGVALSQVPRSNSQPPVSNSDQVALRDQFEEYWSELEYPEGVTFEWSRWSGNSFVTLKFGDQSTALSWTDARSTAWKEILIWELDQLCCPDQEWLIAANRFEQMSKLVGKDYTCTLFTEPGIMQLPPFSEEVGVIKRGSQEIRVTVGDMRALTPDNVKELFIIPSDF